MAKSTTWRFSHLLKTEENGQKTWIYHVQVSSQGHTRVTALRADFSLKKLIGEPAAATLKLPLNKALDTP